MIPEDLFHHRAPDGLHQGLFQEVQGPGQLHVQGGLPVHQAHRAIQQGADIVFAVASAASLGVLDAAKSADAYAIGVDLDQAKQLEANDPEISAHIMTSAMKNLDTLLYNQVQLYLEDSIVWGEHHLFGLKDGTMALADNEYFRDAVPQEVIDEIAEVEEKIVSGEIEIPTAIGMSAEDLQAIKDKA